jgi:hypothetical protein
MPVKFNKEVSAHLFKYVRSIDIKFNPLDSRTRSARELLRQVQAPRFGKANPKLAVRYEVHYRPEAPSAHFKFIDDTEVRLRVLVLYFGQGKQRSVTRPQQDLLRRSEKGISEYSGSAS